MKSLPCDLLKFSVLFPLLVMVTAILAYCVVQETPRYFHISVICLEGILLLLFQIGVVKPRRMVQRGMELLSGQETNSRLTHVGQPDADMTADLFNTLIGRLHQEKLRLKEQDFFLLQLIEASPMGVAIMDFDDRLTQVNPAFLRLLQINPGEDVTGLGLSDLRSPLAKSLANLKNNETITLRDGNRNIIKCLRLTFLESGFRRPFILIENLTDEVMNAERATYGKVIRLMSHEVNNSMTGITTLLEILKNYHCDDPELSEFIESVGERCAAMSRFIASYAEVVRLPDPHLKEFNLGEFINSQLPFLKSNSPYPVESELSDKNLYVNADTDMLSQVLVNIIKNSAEAINETGRNDGRIKITVEQEDNKRNVLTITDNGSGISAETADGLFNPFFSTKPDGQGIGLTMVAEILRRHKAEFSLNTGADGLTRFRIIFPRD